MGTGVIPVPKTKGDNMIATCTCTHKGQDELHGRGKRVFNLGKTSYRCTVCKATKPLTGLEKKDKEKGKK